MVTVRFEIFSFLEILCWSMYSKQRKFHLLVAKSYTEVLLAALLLLTWSMSILVENCKMDGSPI